MRAILAAELEPDSNCVDIGSYEGDFLADMARLAPQGHHIAYEPLPEQFAKLKERFPRLDLRNAAVADETGVTSFVWVKNAPGFSSLRWHAPPVPGAQPEEVSVRVVRLDDDLPAGYAPKLIKVDVNGAERQTFAGALETIRRHRPTIVFEHGRAAKHYGTSPDQIYELLCGTCGMRIFGLRGGEPLSRSGFRESRDWNFVARA